MQIVIKNSILKILPVIDAILSPFMWLSGWALFVIRRIGLHRFPLIQSIFKKIGILPIRNHYYEALCYPEQLRHDLNKVRNLPGIDLNETEQLALLGAFQYQEELKQYPLKSDGVKPFFYQNNFFEAGDAEIYYNMIRHYKPGKIIEIGSGFSTFMAVDAISKNKQDNPSYNGKITCIEPFEHPELEQFDISVVRKQVETLEPEYFDILESGDVLFIDSSHVIRPQGDVLYEILEVLGRLKSGVIVHIHDIFTPRDYRFGTLFEAQYFWNEQYMLEAFLSYNTQYKLLCAVNHLHKTYPEALKQACPNLAHYDSDPCSFWIQKI
tara:strand:- start:77183 stop:78154 length:972 start_codon:yes stop_codon:yes gene_type:complete